MEINEEKLKSFIKKQSEETRRHFDIVAEDLRSDMKLLAESVGGIQEQLVILREMVAKNTEDIVMIKMNMEIIKNSLRKKVDFEEFEILTKRVALLESKIINRK
ncbi:MAG: hypothetical protein A3H02_00220 [Candidatus Niyogibacteria bacterium RIFCSPLOWO2_12_FULL_41_13]|uniref:Uncharacterized protein n=1 Tax=Candidatus Niyogibacteria bacterium RIFCSPLOWO2_12_FULL_41_13 TaxID=1801726 RepID=A0A1G2F3I5_9BACT|nr:MAG: hypothetical protein A3H02_00220 [Candidatus Niyogibacteria bacterium RIFCSPLOWO2_12_FULL_41_13]